MIGLRRPDDVRIRPHHTFFKNLPSRGPRGGALVPATDEPRIGIERVNQAVALTYAPGAFRSNSDVPPRFEAACG